MFMTRSKFAGLALAGAVALFLSFFSASAQAQDRDDSPATDQVIRDQAKAGAEKDKKKDPPPKGGDKK